MNDGVWRSLPDGWHVEPRTGHAIGRYEPNGEVYDVAVSVPRDVEESLPLPLLVVLDGALHFDAVAAAAAALARRPQKTGMGPLVVAGIATGRAWSHDPKRRERDYAGDDAAAERLLGLICGRLIRDASRLARIDEQRLGVFGHSFGGLFALHALMGQSPFFRAIAISPSLWRLSEAQRVGLHTPPGKHVLIASGSKEPRINADLAALPECPRRTRLILTGEDHGSVTFAALPAALRFLCKTPDA